jgi:glucose-6-phosphate 1-dehydrogenase
MAKAEPCLFIIIGVTGDLTHRKLMPALIHLRAEDSITDQVRILGCARGSGFDDQKFRAFAHQVFDQMLKLKDRDGIKAEQETKVREWLDKAFYYEPIDKGGAEDYKALLGKIETIEKDGGLPGDRVYYLALPPQAFAPTIEALGESGLNKSPGWTRIVIEKPFGHDLASAQDLNALVHKYYDESQIYRIDHYLGKETVQNLLAFRFGNAMFESLWNRDRIEHIQITAAETVGVEKRAEYYEHAGAIRDMVQNHITQLVALTAMEVPGAFDAEAIRYEKIKVLRAIAPISPDDVVFGQYTAGEEEGKQVQGYREEPGVAPQSKTETFAALRLRINNWRWEGVPFYIRTGKHLKRHTTQIAITFRCPPVTLFQDMQDCRMEPNILVITIQPEEGFDLSFEVKTPGDHIRLQQHHMRFDYEEAFGEPPDGYQTLLLDVMQGEQTLFLHAEEVEASWKVFTPLFAYDFRPHPYASGTWGPEESETLLQKHGSEWHLL